MKNRNMIFVNLKTSPSLPSRLAYPFSIMHFRIRHDYRKILTSTFTIVAEQRPRRCLHSLYSTVEALRLHCQDVVEGYTGILDRNLT